MVEAPRGTLYHHYKTDDKGIVTNVNLIVGTTNNNAAISMSLKKAAEGILTGGNEIREGQLNMIEMAFRAYDPCFGCATHTLPGDMPLRGHGQERGHARGHRQRQEEHVTLGSTLVLGMGNPILSDDGVGLLVAGRLAGEAAARRRGGARRARSRVFACSNLCADSPALSLLMP